jgi:DNA-binding transcriptional regulator LsrR (DeoR family)
MPKTRFTRERIGDDAFPDHPGMTREELLSVVCHLFCAGHPAGEIATLVKERYGVTLSREQPYRLLSAAASRGWLRFYAPTVPDLEEEIRGRYGIERVVVARSAVSNDVSHHVAKLLMEMVRAQTRSRGEEAEIHVGFAGGSSLRNCARWFAGLLREPQDGLPRRIVFHSMVAGFNSKDPATDPNAFFAYFVGEHQLQVKTRFVGLHAPGIVKTAQMDELRSMEYIDEAYKAVKDIDIIVTSAGGHWQEGHSALYDMYQKASPDSLKQLIEAGCIGDMMWRPLGRNGPIEDETEIRAMTLLDLSQLPSLVKHGKSVVLLLGPCGQCMGSKTEVLQTVLSYSPALITHLVVDSRTTQALLNHERR